MKPSKAEFREKVQQRIAKRKRFKDSEVMGYFRMSKRQLNKQVGKW